MTGPRVEILSFEGCPHREGARRLVERVAAEIGVAAEIELVEVPDAAAAAQLEFLGSPSVRVDGRDVEPGAEARRDFVFSCRVYRVERGFSGQPDAAWIREALTRAAA
jgi:glutaredoxin